MINTTAPIMMAAAMSLAKVGSARVLPALIHAWSHPETPHWLWDREMESVVTDVTIRAAHDDPPTPPADAWYASTSARIFNASISVTMSPLKGLFFCSAALEASASFFCSSL